MSTADNPCLDNPASPPSKKPRLSAAGGGSCATSVALDLSQTGASAMNNTSSNGTSLPNNNGAGTSGIPVANGGNIDEGLYSRQLYVLGREAMSRMAVSNILISGMGGLGVEIAKNVILGGVRSVTLQDASPTTWDDLSSQFYLRKADIGKNRAQCSLTHLSELNPYVSVDVCTEALTETLLQNRHVNVLVLTEGCGSIGNLTRISDFCHENGIAFILAETRGVFARIFCDFGPNFVVTDTNGENPVSVMIAGVTKEEKGVVTCLDETRHGLEDGDYVTFSEIQGMTELNGCAPIKIEVTGPYTFKICDTRGK